MKYRFSLAPLAALLLLAAAPRLAQAQTSSVGIGTTAPDAAAALDIVSSSKGVLLPRLTAAQVAAIAGPATGLLLFQTDGTAGFYYNAGTPAAPLWQLLGAGSGGTGGAGDNLGNHTATQSLNLNGQKLTGGGANGLRVRVGGGVALDTLAGPGQGRLVTVAPDGTLQASAPVQTQGLANTETPQGLGSAVATGTQPISVALNGAGTRAYVVNFGSNTLQAYDVSGSGAPVPLGSAVPTGASPSSVAVNGAGTRAYVVNRFGDTMQAYDVSGGTPVPLGSAVPTEGQPISVAVDAAGTRVSVVNYSSVQLFDVSGGVPVLLGSEILPQVGRGGAMNAAGTRAYAVNSQFTTLQAYDVSGSGAPVNLGRVVTGSFPRSVALNVAGTRAYVVSSTSRTLQVYDVSGSGNPVTLGTAPTGTSPYGVAVNAAGTRAYVVNYGNNTLQVYDVSGSGAPVPVGSPVVTDTQPYSVAVNAAGTRAYVVNYGSNTLQAYAVGGVPTVVGIRYDGTLGTFALSQLADNLGNHTATQNLNLGTNQLVGTTAVNVGSPLNLGTNALVGTTAVNVGSPLNLGANALVGNGGSTGLTIAANGAVTTAGALTATGVTKLSTLGNGSSTRMVTATADGTLGATALPTDVQQLTITGRTISLTNGGMVTVPSGADNLGNHMATTNVGLNNNWLSNAPGNANGLRVDNDGRVGIGTSSLGHPLTVQANVSRQLLGFNDSQGADKYNLSLNGGGLNLSQSNVASGRLFVQDATGNVGIGTTDPDQKLDVAGSANMSGNTTVGGNVGIGTTTPSQKLDVRGNLRLGDDGGNAAGTGQTMEFVGPGVNTDPVGFYRVNPAADQSELRVVVGNGPDANDKFSVGRTSASTEGGIPGGTFTPNFTVQSDGNVGIGTTTPGQKLDVAGSVKITGSGNGLVFPDNTVQTTAANAAGFIQNQTSTAQPGGFRVNGNGYVGGNVGIGTTTPSQKLDVAGNANVNGNVTVNGNVGIGTSSPTQKLDVTGNATVSGNSSVGGSLALRSGTTEKYNWSLSSGGLNLSESNVASGRLFVQDASGNVGIGTTNPAARLDVSGTGDVGANNFAFFRNFNNSANTGYVTNNNGDISIRASGPVLAAEFYATSDRRLKTVVGLSDNAADLALLNRLRITDYTMRDRVAFGERAFKKVIAQEVEAVLPQAVTRQTGFLPDVYATATAAQALPGDSLLLLTLPAGLPEGGARAGQRLKLLGDTRTVLATVACPAVAGSRTLTVRRAQALAGGAVFVYGLEHADVRALDYEALSMLNVSATQELARQVAELRARAATAETKAAQTTATLESLAQRLRALEAGGGADPGAQARK